MTDKTGLWLLTKGGVRQVIDSFIKVFETFGLPVALIVVLLFVIWQMGKMQNETAAKNMKAVQDRCKEREEVLMGELKENRQINAKAIETIAHYAEKLDVIQQDIHDIKHDVSLIMITKGE